MCDCAATIRSANQGSQARKSELGETHGACPGCSHCVRRAGPEVGIEREDLRSTFSAALFLLEIHGLYQQSIGWAGLLSFDSMFTARYLFDGENTVRQAADGSLSIKRVSGWKAINTLTSTWNPPKNNNVGITVTFKDGFDAPKFSRANSLLIGVLIQF